MACGNGVSEPALPNSLTCEPELLRRYDQPVQ